MSGNSLVGTKPRKIKNRDKGGGGHELYKPIGLVILYHSTDYFLKDPGSLTLTLKGLVA